MYGIHRVPWQWQDDHHFMYVSCRYVNLALIKQLPKGYKVCLLKNEFGDLKGWDSENFSDNSR
jgi:hypothetical protein